MKNQFIIKKSVGLVLFFLFCSIGMSYPSFASDESKPTLVSFTITPDTVDTTTANTTVTFDLVVSNPSGIFSTNTQVNISDGGSNALLANLTRTDSPVDSTLQTVEFRGSVVVPSSLPAGAYSVTASPIFAVSVKGTAGYATDVLNAKSSSKVKGAENMLLIRKAGDLNYNYPTFNGPAFKKSLGTLYISPKYTTVADPIWKVGETFVPSDYYEATVSSIALKIKSMSPTICSSDGSILKFIAVGSCSFSVYTDKTLDYQYQHDDEVVAVTEARIKPNYVVGSVATQSSTTLPLSIPLPYVYGPVGYVSPISITPSVCTAVAGYVSVTSGGTCTLNYSSPATSTYLASDTYSLTFQITRTAQSVTFVTPQSAKVESRSLLLSATASSGLPVTFQSTTPTVCSVTENSLNLLNPGNCVVEADQAGSAKISPASATQSITLTGASAPVAKKPEVKTIVCVKKGKSKTFKAAKCPAGYKAKK